MSTLRGQEGLVTMSLTLSPLAVGATVAGIVIGFLLSASSSCWSRTKRNNQHELLEEEKRGVVHKFSGQMSNSNHFGTEMTPRNILILRNSEEAGELSTPTVLSSSDISYVSKRSCRTPERVIHGERFRSTLLKIQNDFMSVGSLSNTESYTFEEEKSEIRKSSSHGMCSACDRDRNFTLPKSGNPGHRNSTSKELMEELEAKLAARRRIAYHEEEISPVIESEPLVWEEITENEEPAIHIRDVGESSVVEEDSMLSEEELVICCESTSSTAEDKNQPLVESESIPDDDRVHCVQEELNDTVEKTRTFGETGFDDEDIEPACDGMLSTKPCQNSEELFAELPKPSLNFKVTEQIDISGENRTCNENSFGCRGSHTDDIVTEEVIEEYSYEEETIYEEITVDSEEIEIDEYTIEYVSESDDYEEVTITTGQWLGEESYYEEVTVLSERKDYNHSNLLPEIDSSSHVETSSHQDFSENTMGLTLDLDASACGSDLTDHEWEEEKPESRLPFDPLLMYGIELNSTKYFMNKHSTDITREQFPVSPIKPVMEHFHRQSSFDVFEDKESASEKSDDALPEREDAKLVPVCSSDQPDDESTTLSSSRDLGHLDFTACRPFVHRAWDRSRDEAFETDSLFSDAPSDERGKKASFGLFKKPKRFRDISSPSTTLNETEFSVGQDVDSLSLSHSSQRGETPIPIPTKCSGDITIQEDEDSILLTFLAEASFD